MATTVFFIGDNGPESTGVGVFFIQRPPVAGFESDVRMAAAGPRAAHDADVWAEALSPSLPDSDCCQGECTTITIRL